MHQCETEEELQKKVNSIIALSSNKTVSWSYFETMFSCHCCCTKAILLQLLFVIMLMMMMMKKKKKAVWLWQHKLHFSQLPPQPRKRAYCPLLHRLPHYFIVLPLQHFWHCLCYVIFDFFVIYFQCSTTLS